MIEDFLFQIAVAALIIAVWIDVARLHKKLIEVDAYVRHMYYMLYYQYHSPPPLGGEEEEKEEEGEDSDKVKESCVLELISRRGCMHIDEVVELCGVSKSFVLNKLYRKRKTVRIDKEGRVCPR
jgi:hypothetical protein